MWRVRNAGEGELCLRRWAKEHPTVERLRLIHAVLGLVARSLPVVTSPLKTAKGMTFVEHGGHLWELTKWLPGAADYRSRPSRERLKAAMNVLARFHMAAAEYKRRTGIAPAVADRQRQLAGMRAKGLAEIERGLGQPLGNEIDELAVRLLAAAGEALQSRSIDGRLAAVPELMLQPAIRDVHHEHVLFTGDEVTGLIDFGALRIDTPLADVARLVGSLVGDDADARRFAFDTYSELRSLGDTDRRLVDLLDESGLVLGGLNWLMWLYVERRDMGPVGPIVKRIDELLVRLESPAM